MARLTNDQRLGHITPHGPGGAPPVSVMNGQAHFVPLAFIVPRPFQSVTHEMALAAPSVGWSASTSPLW